MMGFGSSIFNSASTLITSAVQDDPKITPPLSPKLPTTKDSKSPTATKTGQETKPGHPQLTKASQSVQTKADKLLSATLVVSKAGHSTCPLCKLELNVGSQDPPNYNTCTDCKILSVTNVDLIRCQMLKRYRSGYVSTARCREH
ncbi:hypothetical protein KUCAC02_020845 [Chaenocephalus aceratus]|uniref:Uncharacterized protein n=1 Tax=Chaenocephalus aceratus TaxID=36190 RepID=A0ACB9XEX5_CHAAC|nr:hypothetical protein KUCAC02_020845 [Chaenocephalus aceratus]